MSSEDGISPRVAFPPIHPGMSTEPSLSDTLGLGLLGMGFSTLLYGITCAQTFTYFQSHKGADCLWIRIIAAVLCVLNTIYAAFVMHMLYYYLITAFGNSDMRKHIVWSLPASCIILALISFHVYIVYIWRIWTLSKTNLPCILIAFTSVGHAVTSITLGVLGLTKYTSTAEFYGTTSIVSAFCNVIDQLVLSFFQTYGRVSAGFGIATDLMVALYLCRILSQLRSGHPLTDSTINALMAYIINTGLLAALCVFASLITNITWPSSYLSLFFLLLIAPLETNAFLGSLNRREFFQHYGESKVSRTLSVSDFNARVSRVEVRVDQSTDAYHVNATELMSKNDLSSQDKDSVRPTEVTTDDLDHDIAKGDLTSSNTVTFAV